MSDPNGRFQVVPTPLHAPGYCFLCRGVSNGPFVDTAMSHEWFNEAPSTARDGVVYVCNACVREMYSALTEDDADVQRLIKEARLEGYNNGLAYGKRRIDEFAERFYSPVDDGVNSDTGSNGGFDFLDSLNEEDESGDDIDAQVEPEGNRQADVNGGDERPSGVPSDSAAGGLLDDPKPSKRR